MNKFHKFPTSNKKNLQSNKNKPSLPAAPLSREEENKIKETCGDYGEKKNKCEAVKRMEPGNGKGKGEKIKEVWGRKWGHGGGPGGVLRGWW